MTGPSSPSPSLSRGAVATAAVLAAGVTVLWRLLTFTGFNNDHYVHLSRAYQMRLGEWPVRDFVDPGLPLMYAVSAAFRWVGGPALGVEWILVASAFALAAAGTVIVAGRLSGSVTVALFVATLEVLSNPRSFSYPKLLLYAWAALLLLGVAARPSVARLAGMAVATAIAFLYRHDHGLYIGIGACATILLASVADGWPVVVRRVMGFAGGVALALAPWALFVAVNGGLVPYFQSALEFSRTEAASTLLRDWPPVHGPLGGWSRDDAIGVMFYVCWALPIVTLAIALPRWWRQDDAFPGESTAVAGLAAMTLPVNFGFLYGMMARKFQQFALTDYETSFTMAECQAFRNAFFKEHAGLEAWYKKQEREVLKYGYVESLSGRRRHLPDVKLDPGSSREAKSKYLGAIRQAINTPVQGFASDLKLMSLIEIDEFLDEYREDEMDTGIGYLIGEVHDSVVLVVKKKYAAFIAKRVVNIMRHPALLDELDIELKVPIDAEAAIGPSYGETEEFKVAA